MSLLIDFAKARAYLCSVPALSALGATPTTFPPAHQQPFGTVHWLAANEQGVDRSSIPWVPCCVSNGNSRSHARAFSTKTDTSVQGAGQRITALKSALEQRRLEPHTPYIASTWENALQQANLTASYPHLVNGLHHGFYVGVPTITGTFTPPNNPTIIHNTNAYKQIIEHNLQSGRYLVVLPRLGYKSAKSQSWPRD